MKKPLKTIIYVVFIFGLVGILAAILLYNKPHKNLLRNKPDYVMDAYDLQKEFESDESVATAKFLNKNLEVRGMISDMNLKDGKVISISLQTGNETSAVICNLGKLIDAEIIDKNKPVTVRGELSGFLMDVLLINCIIL